MRAVRPCVLQSKTDAVGYDKLRTIGGMAIGGMAIGGMAIMVMDVSERLRLAQECIWKAKQETNDARELLRSIGLVEFYDMEERAGKAYTQLRLLSSKIADRLKAGT